MQKSVTKTSALVIGIRVEDNLYLCDGDLEGVCTIDVCCQTCQALLSRASHTNKKSTTPSHGHQTAYTHQVQQSICEEDQIELKHLHNKETRSLMGTTCYQTLPPSLANPICKA